MSCETVTETTPKASPSRKKEIRNTPDAEEIRNIQKTFNEHFHKTFLRKRDKYKRILKEYGVSIHTSESCHSVHTNKSFDEEIEIVVSEERTASVTCATAWRKSGSFGLRKLFRYIYHVVRRTKASRIMCSLEDIPQADLDEVLKSVASEISVSYEYQLSMLADEPEVCKAAEYAVSCMMVYLRSKQSVFNATNLLQAVTEETPKQYFTSDQFLRTRIVKSASFKRRLPQRWRLDEIFKQPGIRVPDQEGNCSYYGCFTPYGCMCQPNKYGFRGPLHIWDEEKRIYTMIPNDLISCCSVQRSEVEFDKDNIHHTFVPTTSCDHGVIDISDIQASLEKPDQKVCESND